MHSAIYDEIAVDLIELIGDRIAGQTGVEVKEKVFNLIEKWGMSKKKKDKAPAVRTYDEDGFRYRAVAICLDPADKTKVLLLSTYKSKERFILAGGGVDPGETPEETVLREILEEGGIYGTIDKYVGCFRDENQMRANYLFIILVETLVDGPEWLERSYRLRRWFNIQEANLRLQHKCWQVDLLQRAVESMESAES